ncbi:MAG: aminopeptidase YwaD [Polaribacter sp.]|jgi:aminopeptidase YwaD
MNCIPTNIVSTINAKQNLDLKIYPNPARHILHYESEQVPIWDKVELLDLTGRVVNVVFNNKYITLEGLSSGMYVLRLWRDDIFWTRKIIVE